MYEICREDATNEVKNPALKKMAAFWAELLKMVKQADKSDEVASKLVVVVGVVVAVVSSSCSSNE